MSGSRQSKATDEDDAADAADAAEGDGYSFSWTRGQFLSGSNLPYRALGSPALLALLLLSGEIDRSAAGRFSAGVSLGSPAIHAEVCQVSLAYL